MKKVPCIKRKLFKMARVQADSNLLTASTLRKQTRIFVAIFQDQSLNKHLLQGPDLLVYSWDLKYSRLQ